PCPRSEASRWSWPWSSLLRGRGRRRRRLRRHRRRLLAAAGMAAERPRRSELAELVADHVLRYVQRDELLAVVHRDRVADHLRHHRRAARPGLDHLLLRGGVERVDLVDQVLVDEGALAERAWHRVPLLPRARLDDVLERGLLAHRLVALGRHS